MYDKVMAIRKEIKQKKDKIEQLKNDAEEKATKAKVRVFFLPTPSPQKESVYIPVVVWTLQ